MPFQAKGVAFIERNHGRALLGDDMGLGKTYQAIGWMMLHPEVRPVIVVCPASLKYNWQREFWIHAGVKADVLEGKQTYDLTSKIVIINYDILAAWKMPLIKLRPRLLIIDECHYTKTSNIKRTRVCKSLASRCCHMLALSGTPILNRPIEFYSTLNMLDPEEWGSKLKFGFRYCGPKRGFAGHGWDFSGASNLEELHEKIRRIMIRRLKVDVLTDLPPKRRTYIPIQGDLTEYHRVEEAFIDWLLEKKGEAAAARALRAEALVKLGHLKRVAAESILEQSFEWIDYFLATTSQKLVVFSIHRALQTALRDKYTNAAVIDGTVGSAKERQLQADRFQTDPKCRLMLGGLRPAGVGWTFTAASTTLFLEIGWTPGEHDQAEDRVNRIGQSASAVNAYYLIPRRTIVEKTVELIEAKRKVTRQVLDGTGEDTRNSLVDQLLSTFRRNGDGRKSKRED